MKCLMRPHEQIQPEYVGFKKVLQTHKAITKLQSSRSTTCICAEYHGTDTIFWVASHTFMPQYTKRSYLHVRPATCHANTDYGLRAVPLICELNCSRLLDLCTKIRYCLCLTRCCRCRGEVFIPGSELYGPLRLRSSVVSVVMYDGVLISP